MITQEEIQKASFECGFGPHAFQLGAEWAIEKMKEQHVVPSPEAQGEFDKKVAAARLLDMDKILAQFPKGKGKISDLNMVDPKMYEKLKSFKIMDKEEVLIIKTDARQVALNIAMTLNESLVSVCAVTKDEVMADANEIYDWLTQDLEGK